MWQPGIIVYQRICKSSFSSTFLANSMKKQALTWQGHKTYFLLWGEENFLLVATELFLGNFYQWILIVCTSNVMKFTGMLACNSQIGTIRELETIYGIGIKTIRVYDSNELESVSLSKQVGLYRENKFYSLIVKTQGIIHYIYVPMILLCSVFLSNRYWIFIFCYATLS